MPDTRPGTYFEDGVCGACINYDNRGKIDWTKREEELKQICRHRIGQNEKYDCIAPVSGGKDSTFIVNKLVGLGMRPLLVTITDEFTHTQAGAHNVKNIAEQFNLDHIIFRHAPGDFKGFTLNDFVGELHPLKWIEGKINETPLMIAEALKIPLVFKGEYSPYEYGAVKDLETHITTNNTTIYYMYAFFPYDELETLEVARGLGFKEEREKVL